MVKEKTEHKFLTFIKSPAVLSAIICALFIYLNPHLYEKRSFFYSGLKENDICLLSGKFCSNPVKQGNFYKISFSADYVKSKTNITAGAKGLVDVFVPVSFVELWQPGKLFSVNTSKKNDDYKEIQEPVESGISAVIEGSFDFNNTHSFYAKQVKTFSASKKLIEKILVFRSRCRLDFKRMLYAWGEAGGLLLALLSGAREYTNKVTADAFRNAGLSHIMALSGMHLSLFSGIAVFIGKKLKSKKLTNLFRFLFVLFFVWFAGFTPSLFRAFLCSLLTLGADFSKTKNINQLKILCIAFLLHAAVYPHDLFSQAFILSYGALSGILIFSNYIKPSVSRFLPATISESISSSIGAQAATTPYTAIVFKIFVPSCTIATLLISPLVTVFIYL